VPTYFGRSCLSSDKLIEIQRKIVTYVSISWPEYRQERPKHKHVATLINKLIISALFLRLSVNVNNLCTLMHTLPLHITTYRLRYL